MHWCEIEDCGYSCHGTSTFKKHMATDHHTELGLPAPKCWKCHHCRKEFKSATGHKGHDRLTVKVRKLHRKKRAIIESG